MTPSDVKIVSGNIEDFIEVPDGINRLRKAVLTLAVSGKLVPQDKIEGTAEDFYKQIQTERAKEVEGKKKKIKELPEITSEEIPFEIPSSWKWVRLQGVGKLDTGKTPRTGIIKNYSGNIPFIGPGDVQNGSINSYSKLISEQGAQESKYLHPGDILMVCIGGTIGKTAIVSSKCTFNQQINKITPQLVDSFFLFYTFNTDYFQTLVWNKASGGATPLVNLTRWSSCIIPLPPLEEQKRIVRKVEELMKKIDGLEVKKEGRDEIRIRLARSAMQSLGKGDSKIAFEQLIELIKTPTDIKELENALLTLAVSGKLVPQDKTEGTAEELFNQIQLDRSKNAESKKKKGKESSEITEKEIPFEIPKSWKWIHISDVVSVITDGEHISPEKHPSGVPLVTAKNVIESGVTFENIDYVTKNDAEKFWKRCNPKKGDLLICSRGTVGRTTTVNIEEPFCLMGSVILIKFINTTTADYCKYYLRTHSGVSQIGLMKRGMAVSALYLKDIEKALIPLPPLSEQKRIIKKIGEVMVLINHLKELIKEK